LDDCQIREVAGKKEEISRNELKIWAGGLGRLKRKNMIFVGIEML